LLAKLVEHRCDDWFHRPVPLGPNTYQIRTLPGYAFDGAFWAAFIEADLTPNFVEYEGPARQLGGINRMPLAELGVFILVFSSRPSKVFS
jgi:hypothetical protein